ncbi:MAG: HD domain-containing protein, partial [Saprospiraceae bacterium]|nr:HD domain-containing protein [Saprospiraceae bacterium]
MLDWNTIISFKRFGQKHTGQDARSDFRRDYDKIIFLSGFRRLQNKTQVFPLPGNVFVHNRLTHSLEVSSVGRSIGHIVGEKIAKKYKDSLTATSRKFYKYDLEDVVASACLAHDLGNPAFGHSGEKAISNYFKS